MRNVVMLFNQLNSDLPFEKKYPQFNREDRLVHVLYLSPFLNATGYYRMIAPMLELNKTTTHRAALSGLHKWDFSKQFDDYDNPLDERLILWAHYIVLPAVFSDITYIIEIIKRGNSEAVVLMDVDQNYFDLEQSHPLRGKITEGMQDTLLNNLLLTDAIITSGVLLSDRIEELLRERKAKQIRLPFVMESRISKESFVDFKGVQERKRRTIGAVRIGWIGGPGDVQDMAEILEVLEEIEKEEKLVEVLFFGFSGVVKGENRMGDLHFRYVKSVRIDEYFIRLRDMELDMIILPLRENDFNKGKTAVKFLEVSALGIPALASAHSVYKEKIVDGKNGFLAGDKAEWKEKIRLLIAEKKLRQQIGENARRLVWKNWSYENEGVNDLLEIFI